MGVPVWCAGELKLRFFCLLSLVFGPKKKSCIPMFVLVSGPVNCGDVRSACWRSRTDWRSRRSSQDLQTVLHRWTGAYSFSEGWIPLWWNSELSYFVQLDFIFRTQNMKQSCFFPWQEWYLYKYMESEKKEVPKDRADPTLWRATVTVRCKAARRCMYFIWNIFSVTVSSFPFPCESLKELSTW